MLGVPEFLWGEGWKEDKYFVYDTLEWDCGYTNVSLGVQSREKDCYGLDLKYPPKSSCVEDLVPSASVFRSGVFGR
jgi:hypothetical protein